MPERIELPESHHEHGGNPFIVPVSVTISILAVLVAGVTLLGHRAHTEELLLQSQAASRWAQFQAKSVRLHETHGFSDVVSIVAPLNKEKGEELREKYFKEVEHYESDKGDVGKEAQALENERDVAGRRGDRFDGGEALLEIGLVICSLTLLTKRRGYWLVGMMVAAGGIAFALTAFLLH